jgi:hypothetical protein
MAGVDSLMKTFEEDAKEISGPRYGRGAGERSQTRFFASCGNALALTLQRLKLSQLRDDLFGSQPLLRHRLSPFQAIFSQFAWSRKGRSGQSRHLRKSGSSALPIPFSQASTSLPHARPNIHFLEKMINMRQRN